MKLFRSMVCLVRRDVIEDQVNVTVEIMFFVRRKKGIAEVLLSSYRRSSGARKSKDEGRPDGWWSESEIQYVRHPDTFF